MKTEERLLHHARCLMWVRGYSAVSLREVCRAADVDASMVKRHFGSKRGLFEATREGAFDLPVFETNDIAVLKENILTFIENFKPEENVPTVLWLIIMNASDPEVGEIVRAGQYEHMQRPLERIVGSPTQAAYFLSVLMATTLAETTLKLPGIAERGSAAYRAQLSHMMDAALSCPTSERPLR